MENSYWNVSSDKMGNPTHHQEDAAQVHEVQKKVSDDYVIAQITPVDRFQANLKNGQKIRLGCWVLLRHKQTGEELITGAICMNSSISASLTLAIDLPDFDKFSPL